MSRNIAIVGAGITGLVTAYKLKQADVNARVFESSDRVGGVIRTHREDGFLAEDGPNTLLETSPKIGELIRELGIESRKRYSNPEMKKRFIVRGGRPVSMPLSPAQFATTKLFSLGAKLRLIKEPFIRPSPADAEESLAEFVERRLGREFLDYAINPFVAGVYAGDPTKLSVIHAFAKLHALEQKYGSLIKGQILGARERKKRQEVAKDRAKMMSFDGGLQVLTDALGDALKEQIRFNASITGLHRDERGWKVLIGDAASDETFETVILTSPAHRIAGLKIETDAPADLSTLGEIVYPPVTSYVMGFRREDVTHPIDGFGMLVPEVEKLNILGTIFSSSLFDKRSPEGHVTLSTYIGGMRAPELALKTASRDPSDHSR